MKRRDKFTIALMNLKTSRKNIVFNLIFIVSIVLIVFSLSIYKSFNIILTSENNSFYSHYYFLVYDFDDISFDDISEKLLSNEHVLSVEEVENSEQSLILEKIDDTDILEDVVLVGTVTSLSLNVTSGRELENRGEIVCPVNFYPYDDLDNNKNISRNNVINMKKNLNKELTFSYTDNSNTVHTFNYTLVGLYNNSLFDYDEDRCFILTDDVKEINNLKLQDIDEEEEEYGYSAPIVLIDNNENASSIISDLKENEIYLSASYQPDMFFYEMLPLVVLLVVVLTCSISFIVLILIINKKLKKEKTNIALLKSFGYSNYDVININIYENIIINFICVFIGIIISLIIFLVLKTITYYKPFYFEKMVITYNFISIPICILIAISLSYISVLFFKKELFNVSIIEVMRNDE